MTRTIRTLIALFAIALLPMVARAQAAADDKDKAAAEQAKPPEPPKPVAVPLPPVLSKFNVTFYGYVNFDTLYDTTRSHNEGEGNDAIARPHTQNGENSRWITTARNSRFGFRVAAPEFQGMKASGLIETDFGQMYTGAAEATYYPQGLLRLRQANFKLETPVVDLLMGQTTYLFGWQSSFFPATAAMLGIPGEPFQRAPQLRLSKLIKTDVLNTEIAAGMFRSPQRDAGIPDLQGGIRFMLSGWQGIHSLGAGGTGPYPLSVGISGAMRKYKVSLKPDTNPAKWNEKTVDGNAVSFDVLIPVIPTTSGERGNKLTLVGTYAITKGSGDLLGGITGLLSTGCNKAASGTTPGAHCLSAAMPTGYIDYVLPDNNTVAWDVSGKFHAINWQGIVVGADYYLPPSGRVFVSATYSQAKSDNVADYAPAASKPNIYTLATHYDGNIFFDVTPAVRLVASYQHRETKYADGVKGKNDRYHFSAYYNF